MMIANLRFMRATGICRPILMQPRHCFSTAVGVSHIMQQDQGQLRRSIDRKTKIVCTVGPTTADKENVMKLLLAGMNVMRLNCSHGDHDFYRKVIGNLRECIEEVKNDKTIDFTDGAREDVCAIALDTKGPEIRTGTFKDTVLDPENPLREIKIDLHSKVMLHTHDSFRTEQDHDNFYVDYKEMPSILSKGSRIFVDDGLLQLIVDDVDLVSGTLTCTAQNAATLGENKGVNLPLAHVTLPAVSEKDKKDLLFAKEIGVDFIFASFIRNAQNVKDIRAIVGDEVEIISKIENQEGLDNIEAITDESDGIMVARGDLGIEIPIENVFLAQKRIVSICNIKGKPVICATQMLESMINSPRPTRAECGDVANAVLDGTDAVMLSGETAKGKYPIEAVKLMGIICQTAEMAIDHRSTCDAIRAATRKPYKTKEALVISAVIASFDEEANLIVILAETGATARVTAKYRPEAPIICVTTNPKTARRMQVARGIHVVLVPEGMGKSDMISSAMKSGVEMGICEAGDKAVVVHSESEPGMKLTPNVMKLVQVPTWL